MAQFDYYGNLKGGGTGWNTSKSAFIDGGILDASESGMLGGHLYNGTGGTDALSGSVNAGWGGIDTSGAIDFLTGSTVSDGKGGQIKSPGLASMGLSAFNTWNAWDQGNKMYDLQSEAFDFSKDKFWNNYAQQTDLVNRAKNKTNRQIKYKKDTMGMSGAEADAYYKNIDADRYKGGDVVEVDGSRTTVGQAIPGKYAGTTTPAPGPAQSAMVGPTINNAAPIGGPTVANAAQSAMLKPKATPAQGAAQAPAATKPIKKVGI